MYSSQDQLMLNLSKSLYLKQDLKLKNYYKKNNRNIISAKEFLTIVDDNRYE